MSDARLPDAEPVPSGQSSRTAPGLSLRPRPTPATQAATPARSHEVVYEDEHVLMEWSVRSPPTDTVAVTFDPIFVDPEQPAYAAAFLHRAGVDTLCVRKKQEHFYQPLSRAQFDAAAAPVLGNYRRRLAYGSSLGAYAVLYFCAHGFEVVISSSPRVSAHPRFGRPHWQKRVTFEHAWFDAARPATSGAVVFYDPHDEMDRSFVDDNLRPAWPQARIVAVPYAGHPANQFLSEIGYIAPFVSAVSAGKTPPELDRHSAKARSFTYRLRLAAACLVHGKARWAESLCRQALGMKPDITGVKLTLGRALMAQGRLDEAEAALLEFQAAYPQDGDAQHALRSLELERTKLRRRHWWPEKLAEGQRHVRRLRGAVASWPNAGAAALLSLTGSLGLSVTRSQIEWCYHWLLGRPPESEAALLAHRRCRNLGALLRTFVGSQEYAERTACVAVQSTLEQRACLALLAYQVLPANGHMRAVHSTGLFSPAACPLWLDDTAPQGAAVALVVRSEPVEVGSTEWEPLLHMLSQGLTPGAHALLLVETAAGTPRPALAMRDAGFEQV